MTEQPTTILHVEDDQATRYAVSSVLERAGYRVWQAATGAEALQLAANRPDLVLLDMQLPDIDGIEVCRRLKQDQATAAIPVLNLSARRWEERDRVEALESGADGYLTQPDNPKLLLATIRALLRARRSADEARESARKFQALFDRSLDPLLLANDNGRYLDANPAACVLLGRSREQILNLSVDDVTDLPAAETARVAAEFQAHQEMSVEWRIVRPSGEVRLVEIHALANISPGQHFAILHDVTARREQEEMLRRAHSELEARVGERTVELEATIDRLQIEILQRERAEEALRQSRERLQALAARRLSIQEEERARIARDVHDELGQALTGLKIGLVALQRGMEPGQADRQDQVGLLVDLVDETIQTVRRIATDLRPRVLDDLGLVAALEWQVQDFVARTGIPCDQLLLPADEDVEVAPELATALFRILQEALTNVCRHAEASKIDVQLSVQLGHLVLEIQDNGRGVRPGDMSNFRSLGLAGMQERVLPWAGTVEILGAPGVGTYVRVEVPMDFVTSGGRR